MEDCTGKTHAPNSQTCEDGSELKSKQSQVTLPANDDVFPEKNTLDKIQETTLSDRTAILKESKVIQIDPKAEKWREHDVSQQKSENSEHNTSTSSSSSSIVASSSNASNGDAKEKMDDKDSSEEGEDSSKGGESLSEEDLPKSVDVNTGTKFPKSNENRNKPLMLPSLKEQRIKNYMDKIGTHGVQVTISSTNDKPEGNEPVTDSKEDSPPKNSELKEKAENKKSSTSGDSMKNIKDKKGEESKNSKGDKDELDISNNPPAGSQKTDDKKKLSKTGGSVKNVKGKKGEDSKKLKSDTEDFDFSNNPPEGYEKIDDKKFQAIYEGKYCTNSLVHGISFWLSFITQFHYLSINSLTMLFGGVLH